MKLRALLCIKIAGEDQMTTPFSRSRIHFFSFLILDVYRDINFRLLTSPDFIWSFQVSRRFYYVHWLTGYQLVGFKWWPDEKKIYDLSTIPKAIGNSLGLQRHLLGELHVFNHNLKWAGHSLSCLDLDCSPV